MSKDLNKFSKLKTGERGIILSDVDGTLVKGSLVLDHACWLHDKKIIDLKEIPQAWMNDQKNETLISKLAEAYREEITGMTLREIQASSYLKNVMKDSQKFYSSLARLKQAKALGHEVVLISGSPQFLIGSFARSFGFKGIGSKYHRDSDYRFTGEVSGMFYAAAKLKAVEKLKVADYKLVVAYGDTASDKPLLDAAHHKVLVNPSQETLKAYDKVHEVLMD